MAVRKERGERKKMEKQEKEIKKINQVNWSPLNSDHYKTYLKLGLLRINQKLGLKMVEHP